MKKLSVPASCADRASFCSQAEVQLIDRVKSTQFRGIAKVTEAYRIEYYKLVKRILSEQTLKGVSVERRLPAS